MGLRAPMDVVEGTNLVVYPVAWLIGAIRRRPVIFHYADVILGDWVKEFGRIGVLGEIAERLALRLPVSAYIAGSASTANDLVKAGVPRRQISVIPYGYEPDLVARAAAQRETFAYSICVVGRMVRYKSVDVVIRAFARLARDDPELKMCIVGRGPEERELRQLAARLGVADRVRFHGFIPTHLEVLQIMASSRIVVSASSVEGFGIVLVEAMALGVPFIASDIAPHREFLEEGSPGILFQPGDDADLAARAHALLEDPAAYSRCVTEGRRLAPRYTWERTAALTEDVFNTVVAAHPISTRSPLRRWWTWATRMASSRDLTERRIQGISDVKR